MTNSSRLLSKYGPVGRVSDRYEKYASRSASFSTISNISSNSIVIKMFYVHWTYLLEVYRNVILMTHYSSWTCSTRMFAPRCVVLSLSRGRNFNVFFDGLEKKLLFLSEYMFLGAKKKTSPRKFLHKFDELKLAQKQDQKEG